MKVRVYHRLYGCDTGCCGHVVEVEENGTWQELNGSFDFTHPYGEDYKGFAIKFAKEQLEARFGKDHCFDLVWEECEVIDEC